MRFAQRNEKNTHTFPSLTRPPNPCIRERAGKGLSGINPIKSLPDSIALQISSKTVPSLVSGWPFIHSSRATRNCLSRAQASHGGGIDVGAIVVKSKERTLLSAHGAYT
jgi:hypothetical protein